MKIPIEFLLPKVAFGLFTKETTSKRYKMIIDYNKIEIALMDFFGQFLLRPYLLQKQFLKHLW